MMSKSFMRASSEQINCDCADGNCFLKCLYFVLSMGVLMELLLGSMPFNGGFADDMWVHDIYFVSLILALIALLQWMYQTLSRENAGNVTNQKTEMINKSINYKNYLKGGGLLLAVVFLVTGCIAVISSSLDSGIGGKFFQYNMMVHEYFMYLIYGYIPFYYLSNRFFVNSLDKNKNDLKLY